MRPVARSGEQADGDRKGSDFPQLPPAPEDYPVFPDKSTWPVVFPELPPSRDGGPTGHRSTCRRRSRRGFRWIDCPTTWPS